MPDAIDRAPEAMDTSRFEWVFRCPVGDPNYAGVLPQLSDGALAYCLQNETRKGGLQLLTRERKRRARARP